MNKIVIKILLMGGVSYSLYPLTCYAYLDPGSGNALIALFLSLAGAAVYFVKSFFYRILALLTGHQVVKTDKSVPDFVIVSYYEIDPIDDKDRSLLSPFAKQPLFVSFSTS